VGNRYVFGSMLAVVVAAALILAMPSRTTAQLAETTQVTFDPHDVSGVWWVDAPGPEAIFARGKGKDASKCESCHPSEHTMPEPPLTPWAKEHAVIGDSGFHAAAGKNGIATLPAAAAQRNTCDPIGAPAQFWYTQLYPFEFVATPGRIFQFFEKQNEWRVIWMNRGHPSNPEPTYMGDSVGKWEGDTLVVDTVGFNGKTRIEPVGLSHRMSDSFHLVERWRRTRMGAMQVDVTYYDPKVWGDNPWGGLRHEFLLQPKMQIGEAYCTAEDNARFDAFVKPALQPARKKETSGK
jgi:hypothetical protein